jgi:hypothetical protein
VTSIELGPALAVAWLGWVSLQLVRQSRTGQTAGKHCMGLWVVDLSDGSPIGLPRTLLRWSAHAVDTCVPIAWTRALLGHDVRTFADVVAHSTVVERRRSMPPVRSKG